MITNYECKKIKIGKFYLWYYTKPFGINCCGYGEFSLTSFFHNKTYLSWFKRKSEIKEDNKKVPTQEEFNEVWKRELIELNKILDKGIYIDKDTRRPYTLEERKKEIEHHTNITRVNLNKLYPDLRMPE